VDLFESASNVSEFWSGFLPTTSAPVAPAEPAPGSSTYEGPGGGPPEAAASAFAHFMEEVEELGEGELERAPEVAAEREDLPREAMDAVLDDMGEALARPEPDEVTSIVTSIGNMNDTQRKEALDNMSDADFDAMMENLPPEEQERLGALANATDDPKRKLRMWSAAEKAELGRDERNLAKVPTSEEVPEDAAIVDRAMKAASDGKDEIDNEVEVAMTALQDPTLSPEAQKSIVDELIRRKEKEREIEKKFNVNLTNDKGGTNGDGKPTPRATWSEKELTEMDVVLDRLPPEAIEENPDLAEIRRAQKGWKKDKTGAWVEKSVVGTHNTGTVTVYDATMSDTQDHHGDSSDIAGIHKMTALQQTIAHEVAHNVDRYGGKADADAVRSEADFRDHADSPDMEARVDECKGGKVASDGRIYSRNEDGSISSVDAALMPDGGAHTEGHEHGDENTWDYARTKKSDYFAEMYSKAIVAPELLYKDMIEGPRAKAKALREAGAPQSEIDEAERVANSMAAQHAQLRVNVLKVDSDVEASNELAVQQRAEELGLDDEARAKLMADYRKQAKQAMTPEQLEAVKNGFVESAYDY
jgi:hypothetical protein